MNARRFTVRFISGLAVLGLIICDRPDPFSQTLARSLNSTLAQARPSTALAESRIGVGNVRLGMVESAVRRSLGKPQQIKTEKTECCGNLRFLTYPKLTVSLIEGERLGSYQVYGFSTTRTNFPTPDGVKVGDSRSKVLNTYGLPLGSTQGSTLSYRSKDEIVTLTFLMVGDRVKEIDCDSLLN